MTCRYYLTEPYNAILGWVLSRREREVSRAEYEQAAEAAGYGWMVAEYDSYSFQRRGGWMRDGGTDRKPQYRYQPEVSGRMELEES